MSGRHTAPAASTPPPATGGGSLRRSTTRGFLWSFGSAGGQAILQIGSLAVLGHLLSPHEYGVVNASMLAVAFTSMLGQLGVAAAIVQKPDLTEKQATAALYFSIVTTFGLGVLFWIFAPWLNLLVGLPQSSGVIRLLAFMLPLTGLTIVPMGLLQRNLKFRKLAMVDISSYAVGFVLVSISLAALGFGPYALAWGQLMDTALTAVGYFALSRVGWTPQSPRALFENARSLLKFGLSYSLGQVGTWVAINGDNFIVANRLPTATLGVYGRAYQLLASPANLIGGVADKVLFPAMSRVQGDPPRMMRAYVSACAFVALATVPSSVILFIGAPEIVGILLGHRWTAVVAPLQIFALVLLPRTSYKISGSFTRARGAVLGASSRQWLYAAEVVVGCLIGSRYGVVGVATGAAIAITLHWLTMIAYSAKVSRGLWALLGVAYLRYLPLATVDVGVALLAQWGTEPLESRLLSLIAVVIAVLGGTAAVVAIARRAFADETALLKTILSLLPGFKRLVR